MNPIDVIIWSCVVIFVITAILTLLHISGVRPLPDTNHGKVLFRALIVEIVVIAIAAFGSKLIPPQIEPFGSGVVGPSTPSEGIYLDKPPVADDNLTQPSVAITPDTASASNEIIKNTDGSDCNQITISDSSTYPPTSRKETICEN